MQMALKKTTGNTGCAESILSAPRQSLTWPSVNSKTIGLPSLSETAWSLEFSPTRVRPMPRERAPFSAGWRRCDEP